MDLALKGRIAVVGGSSQGIGYGIARVLAAEGASIVLVARREEPLGAAAERIREETGSPTFAVAADIRKAEDCDRIIARAIEHFGQIDILVNNDGAPPLGVLESFDDAAWARAVEQNLMSVVRLSRGALRSMKKNAWGRVINITASSVLAPRSRFGLSVATWAGVIGYGKTLSLEVATEGITVHTICPGRIDTPRLGSVFGKGAPGQMDASQRAEMIEAIPMKRLGTLDDCAGLVAFLCSPWAAYMTGCVFSVDGGRRANLI